MLYRLLAVSLSLIKVFGDTQLIPNSCAELDDGEHYVKMLDGDDYPVVKVKCSNGYTMLDYNLDNDISSYFTSFLKWHYSIGGASQTDHINWQEWFVPNDGATKYIVSDACDVCDESVQKYGTSNGYYMNANLFGCFVYPRGMPDCDFDINTYECHACYSTVDFGTIYQTEFGADDATDMGACMNWIREASAEVDRTFDECTYQTDTGFKPTIGVDGQFCVCVKPSATQYYSIDSSLITAKEETLSEALVTSAAAEAVVASKQEKGWDYQTKYLYAADFAPGTLRIKEPGTYILMEDVEFDWNAGDISDDPNAYGAWWPSENDENYPGWGETRESYFMGFFAGITIECDNVIIDLNGHKLAQSKAFFYQQGFFSDIEVQSQPFIPGQGVGFFGSDPMFPENVVIKNGYLGRTSHHCIHGNYNKNMLIEDIVCSDFSTHGIQLNGFEGVTLRNVEVGPSNDEQYLASEYTHYRFVLERLRKVIEEENPTDTIQFVDRDAAVGLDELREKLQNEMNYAFKYVVLGEEGDDSDPEWVEAKKVFISSSGYGYGASVYGVFLSYPGANVLSYHINSKISNTATLENVYIHDISHKTKEYVGLRTDLRMFVNSFNAPLHLQYLIGDELFSQYIADGGLQNFESSMHYVGNILTDVTIALHEIAQNWGRLQIMYLLSDELVAWAKGVDPTVALGDATQGEIQYLCAVDGMIHAAKGAFGLRIDGVDSVSIDTMTIENIAEYADLGYEMCGPCSKCAFEARTPYQIGYAGNMAQGISADYATNMKVKDLTIRNVASGTGRAIGFSVWPGTEVTLDGTILVQDIKAGFSVQDNTLRYGSRPNAAPEACAIRVYDSLSFDASHNDQDFATYTLAEGASVSSECVVGHSSCWAIADTYTQIGEYSSCAARTGKLGNKLIDISSRIHTRQTNNNYSLPIIISSAIIILGVVIYSLLRCTQTKKVSLMKTETERVPLIQYGSIQH